MRLLALFAVSVWVASAMAQNVDPGLIQHLRWRCIGPHRAGRTVGASGIPGRPNEFLIGVNNGGVWKTADYGRTWRPIFDDQPTGSIGFLAVAPSAPDTIYVGCGEGLQRPDLSIGDGVYRSTDGGKTWVNTGLRDGQQISCLAVDPRDAKRVYAAVLGHPYGPNETRGLYRSLDGGGSWGKVLGPDAHTGAAQIVIDPKNPDTLYCDLWAGRQAPWENGRWQGPKSGLYKSTDGGDKWRPLTKGLPGVAKGLGRIGVGLSPSDPRRLYATVDAREGAGIYRSDDGGESWNLISSDPRLWGRGDDFAEIKVDPSDPNTVYCANTACYKSSDGGKTWEGWKGAPGGDDYHTIWIDPANPRTILLATDQGATITVNGGETWSSWYNQPTAQFYHVSTDNQWPYWVYSGQQESGSVGIASRGNDGQITFREWHPVGAEEYGYVAVDPLDPNIVFGGKLSKYDRRTGQVQDVSPEGARSSYRVLRTAPVIFSPVDPKLLYYGTSVLFASRNGGSSWQALSGDLSREKPDVPTPFNDGQDKPQTPGRRGVVYSIGPSHFTTKTVWCGTDDGLVWVTRDGGKTWKDVTPKQMTSWSKVSQIDAGHFSDETAYVSVNRLRCDDLAPYIYATHDGGKTWKLIVSGLPNDPVNAVREDPVRKGLLYCATERMVHFSMDDGANWTSLRLNMPCTSVRDLVVKDDDLVIGTHGRSFWILDNVTALRQLTDHMVKAVLFTPQLATRVRWNMNTDTPLPPEEPGGQNPPDGAMVEYFLPSGAAKVSLEVIDAAGKVVRTYTSDDKPFQVDPGRIPLPTYWLRPPTVLEKTKGSHRWLWDMRRQPLDSTAGVPMAAIFEDTPATPTGPWVPPGNYTVRLTVDGASVEAPLTLRIDPRVTTSQAGIDAQSLILTGSYEGLVWLQDTLPLVRKADAELIRQLGANPERSVADQLSKLQSESAAIIAQSQQLERALGGVMGDADATEMAPTDTLMAAYGRAMESLAALKTRWRALAADPHLKP
ncbi:MAG: glycoside hydrolase [Armatimonadetes bacterium]|nr:glycoside hydrolase [Armatimonadota bacterium]